MGFRFCSRLFAALVLLPLSILVAEAERSPQHDYIEKYSRMAVAEMYRSGVPASITLAQGMIESSNGQSELAVRANNHFGIKCHDWKGARLFYDDDRKGECFRKYSSPEESFRDHSDFLRYRDRYKFLFDLETTDYKGWAYGLKRAGYATDPAYPRKLIKLIEDYDLDRFDSMSEDYASETGRKGSRVDMNGKKADRKAAREHRRNRRQTGIPASPSVLEQAVPLSQREGRAFALSLSRKLYSQNGVAFVYSVEGETYSDIAEANGLFVKELLRFNDLSGESDLLPGTVVYLQRKKSRAAEDIRMHIVDSEDETLREIAQRYGVRLKSIMKRNGFAPDRKLHEGDVVRLR